MKYPYEIKRKLKFAPNPTYEFQFGDEVEKEGIYDGMVDFVSSDKKVYRIRYSEGKEENGKTKITNTGLKMFVLWYEIRKPNKNKKSFTENKFYQPLYQKRTIQSILDRILFWGCNFEADYREDISWTKKQKTAYLTSVFHNVELGTFKMCSYLNDATYECVDGTERLKLLVDFYTDNFSYNGKTFSDLTKKDKEFFLNRIIMVADLESSLTKEELEKYYILSNIEKVKKKG